MSYLSIPKRGKVAVVGAGISGLTFAFFLNKLRPDVFIKIYEKQPQAGGYIRTDIFNEKGRVDPVTLEKGPRTLRGVSEGSLLIVDILRELQCGDIIEVMPKTSIANKKYLLSGSNALIQVPDDGGVKSMAKFMNSELSSGLIWGLLGEAFRKRNSSNGEDESVESFMSRRFGSNAITTNIFSAVLHGIYAGDVSKLSANSIIPKMTKLETDHGSIIKGMLEKRKATKAALKSVTTEATSYSTKFKSDLSDSLAIYEEKISPNAKLSELSKTLKKFPMLKLTYGLQDLPRALSNHLSLFNNIEIEYNSVIESIDLTKSTITETRNGATKTETFDHIRSTINSKELSNLLSSAPKGLSDSLESLEYVSIFLVNIYSSSVPLIPKNKNGFGFLVPKKINNPECLLGVIFDSDIEQHAKPLLESKNHPIHTNSYSKITLMMGGHHFNHTGIPSTKVSLSMVRKVLTERLGINLDGIKVKFLPPSEAGSATDISLDDNEVVVSYMLHKDCIPQYNVGYGELRDKVRKHTSEKFSLGGMAFASGIGVPDCVQNSLEDAIKLCK